MGYHYATPMREDAGVMRDRRAYPRFPVALQGVCSVAGGADEACRILDLSLGGARVAFGGNADQNAETFLLLPHLGLLSARVTRLTAEGFAVGFGDGAKQRRRIRDYLVFALTLQDDRTLEDRVFDRIVPLRRTVEIRGAGGAPRMARIRDVSRSGVALTTTIAMAVGETVHVGSKPAEIVRLFEGGVAARFLAPLPPTFDATVIL